MASITLWFYCSTCKAWIGTLGVDKAHHLHTKCGGRIIFKVNSKYKPPQPHLVK